MAHHTRLAHHDDLVALVPLAARTFPLACPPDADPAAIAEHISTQLSPARFDAWLVSDDDEVLVAVDDAGALLGYTLTSRAQPQDEDVLAALDRTDTSTGTRVELSKIYVDAAAQGSGVAGELMRAALDGARERLGGRLVWLGTNSQNQRAQAFYRKHGFELAGGRTYVVGGQAHSDVVMVRTAY